MLKRIYICFLVLLAFAACAPATPTLAPVPTASLTPTSTPQAPQLPWWRDALFYEIFVRSFYDTDGNGIGDFNGITQKLDYLQQLGINAIWLMPIHPSPSYHGYDVINYYAVNSQYGTMDDFKHLLQEAHQRGMHIIIDLVLNHTSSQHPWFVDANSNRDSKYRDYYIWSDIDQGSGWYQGQHGFYFAIFCDCMPDLNYRNPAVTADMLKVTDYWLNTIGVDGFRVDAAKHLIEEGNKIENTPSTHEWYKKFYPAYKAQNPQAYTVGEVFGAGASVVKSYTGNQLDQVFNFEMSSGFVNSVNGGSNSGITSAIKFALQDMPDFNFATFLTNHDQNRAISVFNGNIEKAKAAATLLLTSPGTPFIYYGEEIGMQGVKPDEDIRLPMQWSADANAGFSTSTPWRAPASDYGQVNVAIENGDQNSLLNHYRKLVKLRKENPGLNDGQITLVDTGNSAVYAALLHSADEKILVIVNLKGTAISDYQLSLSENLLADGVITPKTLFGKIDAIPVTISGGKFSEYKPIDELPPYASYLFQLK
ncbi:MAG TPA: alpha-amylase family glycosyl hydrolase [Anaerolineales bacterium]|nr:alpha-amylase family glycosyl hydrolase [Anaerolineales bacterium]